MAHFEIQENPEYTEKIRKFETTDDGHADLFNTAFQALITNDAFLKKVLEKQGIDIQGQFQQQYEQLTGYTDTKIGQLINGAPETLDTIKEVADAILQNETVVEALNEAVGKKLNKDGDLTDTTVTFTNEDEEEPTGWKHLKKIASAKIKDIFNHISIMSNNLKYLRKLLGENDISSIADGTITGAVSVLNTGIHASDWKTSTVSFMDCTKVTGRTSMESFLDEKVVPRITAGTTRLETFIECAMGPFFCALTVIYADGKHFGGIVFTYSNSHLVAQFSYDNGFCAIRFL